jgi:hypothetical protein
VVDRCDRSGSIAAGVALHSKRAAA